MKEVKLTIRIPDKKDAKRLKEKVNETGKNLALIGRLSLATSIAALAKGANKLADKVAPKETRKEK